jgi:hypothetical protein
MASATSCDRLISRRVERRGGGKTKFYAHVTWRGTMYILGAWALAPPDALPLFARPRTRVSFSLSLSLLLHVLVYACECACLLLKL